MYVNQFFISSISNLGNSCTGLEIVGKLQKGLGKKKFFDVLQLYIDLFGTYTGGSRGGGDWLVENNKTNVGCPRCLPNF